MKKNIAIIPARGGSKRLLGKNIKLLGNLPLFVHSINYAKENNTIIDDILVTTDDLRIKELALENGIMVLNRPQELSGDDATTISVLKHVLENVTAEYENVFLLQPTNPLRPKKLLHEAYSEFKKGYDSLFTVTRSHQKLGKIVNGVFEPFNYTPGQRSQDMEPLFFENGLLYIAKGDLILNNKLMGEKCLPFEVDHFFAHIDIDTEQDFNLANIAYNHSF